MSSITRGSASDAAAIAALLADAFAEYRPLYTAAAFAATTPPADVIASRLREGPVWVCRDARIVGTVAAVPRRDDLYLRSMAVDPGARGRGIGAELLVAAEQFARELQYQTIALSTTPFLDRAIALYERWGFVRTGEPPHDLFGTPLLTLRKRVY